MARIDDILASVIKGATEAGAAIEQQMIGREEKLAGLGGAAGSLAGPLGSAAGAGLQDKNWGSAAGAGAGALLGGAAGGALGGMAGRSLGELIDADPHLSQAVGSILGMLGGGAAGGHFGQNAMRPEKQANLGGLGGAAGYFGAAAGMPVSASPAQYGLGLHGGAGIGAALGADPGHRLEAAAGAVGGGALGRSLGGVLGALTKHPDGANIGRMLGNLGGAALGGHALGHGEEGLLDRIRGKFSSAEDAYLAGSANATARYKVALLPLIGALAGPMLGRMALGRVAGGALGRMGGGAVGRMAGGLANAKGMGGAAVDMGASMAGQQLMS
jgi:hypothetical protein